MMNDEYLRRREKASLRISSEFTGLSVYDNLTWTMRKCQPLIFKEVYNTMHDSPDLDTAFFEMLEKIGQPRG